MEEKVEVAEKKVEAVASHYCYYRESHPQKKKITRTPKTSYKKLNAWEPTAPAELKMTSLFYRGHFWANFLDSRHIRRSKVVHQESGFQVKSKQCFVPGGKNGEKKTYLRMFYFYYLCFIFCSF